MAAATVSAGLALPSLGLILHDGGRVTEATSNAGASSNGNAVATNNPSHSGRGSPSSPRSARSSDSPRRHPNTRRVRSARSLTRRLGTRTSRRLQVDQSLGIQHTARLVSVQTEDKLDGRDKEDKRKRHVSEYDAHVHMAAEDMQNRIAAACQAMHPYLVRLKPGQLILEVGSRSGDVALQLSKQFEDLIILPTEGTGDTSPALFLLLQERLAAIRDADSPSWRRRGALTATMIQQGTVKNRLGKILPPRYLDGANLQSWRQKLAPQDVNCICTVNVLQYLSAEGVEHFLQGSRDTLLNGGILLIAGPFIDYGEASDNLLVYDGTLQNFANSPDRNQEEIRGEMKWGCHDTQMIIAAANQVGFELVAQDEIRGAGGLMWLLIVLKKRVSRVLKPMHNESRTAKIARFKRSSLNQL